MKRFEMDCYEVRETDGGGMPDFHIAYVSNNTLAQELAGKERGWRNVRPYKKTITIFESIEEVESNSKENLRKSGLEKLTEAERKALGV